MDYEGEISYDIDDYSSFIKTPHASSEVFCAAFDHNDLLSAHVRTTEPAQNSNKGLRKREIYKFLTNVWNTHRGYEPQPEDDCRHQDNYDLRSPISYEQVYAMEERDKAESCQEYWYEWKTSAIMPNTVPNAPAPWKFSAMDEGDIDAEEIERAKKPQPVLMPCRKCDDFKVDFNIAFESERTATIVKQITRDDSSMLIASHEDDGLIVDRLVRGVGIREIDIKCSDVENHTSCSRNDSRTLSSPASGNYAGIRVHSQSLRTELLPDTEFFCIAISAHGYGSFRCSHGKKMKQYCCGEFFNTGRFVYRKSVSCIFDVIGCVAAARMTVCTGYSRDIGWDREVLVFGLTGMTKGKYGRNTHFTRCVFSKEPVCFSYVPIRADSVIDPIMARCHHYCGLSVRKFDRRDHLTSAYFLGKEGKPWGDVKCTYRQKTLGKGKKFAKFQGEKYYVG